MDNKIIGYLHRPEQITAIIEIVKFADQYRRCVANTCTNIHKERDAIHIKLKAVSIGC